MTEDSIPEQERGAAPHHRRAVLLLADQIPRARVEEWANGQGGMQAAAFASAMAAALRGQAEASMRAADQAGPMTWDDVVAAMPTGFPPVVLPVLGDAWPSLEAWVKRSGWQMMGPARVWDSVVDCFVLAPTARAGLYGWPLGADPWVLPGDPPHPEHDSAAVERAAEAEFPFANANLEDSTAPESRPGHRWVLLDDELAARHGYQGAERFGQNGRVARLDNRAFHAVVADMEARQAVGHPAAMVPSTVELNEGEGPLYVCVSDRPSHWWL